MPHRDPADAPQTHSRGPTEDAQIHRAREEAQKERPSKRGPEILTEAPTWRCSWATSPPIS